MPDIKDSGERQAFDTGAVRDAAADKICYELISPLFEERLAGWLTQGARKYARRNWEQGIPIERCFASLRRHLHAWQLGQSDEDHLAAAACNLMFIIHNEEAIKHGLLPSELNDMPVYTAERK
jgi:hypothetical protein